MGTPSVKLFFKKVEKINKEPMAVQSMYIDEQSYSRADSVGRVQRYSRLNTMLDTAVQYQFEGGATVQNSCVSQHGAGQVKESIWE